jgi:hypothetical protein
MAGRGDTQVGTASTEATTPLPDLMPWRVVGWVFRDGECIAIERQGDQPAPTTGAD